MEKVICNYSPLSVNLILLFNLWSTVDKLVLPEVVSGVLNEFNEGDEQSPRMRAVYYQPLQENSSDLLLNGFSIGLGEQREKGTTEVVGVVIGIAKLVGNGIQEEITT